MACLKGSELWRETKKVRNAWVENKTIQKWGFENDTGAFKRVFETSTGKELLAGYGINAKDIKKFQVGVEDFISNLQSPGILSNKLMRSLFVGQALSMRSPTTQGFFDSLVKANNFRNSQTHTMMSSYKNMIKNVKLAILEANEMDTTGLTSDAKMRLRELTPTGLKRKGVVDTVFGNLNKMERAYLKELKDGSEIGVQHEMSLLHKFLKDKEGVIFQDLMERITQTDNSLLIQKYKDPNDPSTVISSKRAYINRIDSAASAWREVQDVGKTHLVQSIKNMNQIIDLKYGERSTVAEKLTEQYSEIARKLEEKEGGYVPHFVLDIMAHSMEIPLKIAKSESRNDRDRILQNYISEARNINVGLTQRLKEKGKLDEEYFSRNPMLYATEYIKQVAQFNHSTYVNLAYTKGVKKLSEVALRNAGEKEGKTAEVYSKILTDLHSRATGKTRIEDAPQADNLIRLLSSFQFISKLGFSPRGALRNATQRLLNFSYFGAIAQKDATVATMTDTNYKKAMEVELDKHGLKFLDIAQVTEGIVTASDMTNLGIDYNKGMFTAKESETLLNHATKKGMQAAEFTSKFTKWAENSNRRATFNVAFHQRLQQLKKTDKYSNWEGDTSSGKQKLTRLHEKAGNYAAKMTSLLHFEYSPFGKAKIFTGRVGTAIGTFQHYAFSFANLQKQMYNDFIRATKAGDYTGPEVGRIIRHGMLYTMADLVSGVFNADFSSYINNDTFSRAKDLVAFLIGDEEESKKAFYGKGLVGATGIVPLSDLIELHNLGAAAGYWKLLADEDSTMGWLAGMRKYKKIDDGEFAGEVAGMFSIEAERIIKRTIPALGHENRTLGSILHAEFGLYPGQTAHLGIKTRSMTKKLFPKKKKMKGVAATTTKEQRAQRALAALALMD